MAKLPTAQELSRGVKHGFRSNLELLVAEQLEQLQAKYKNFTWAFEPEQIPYYRTKAKQSCYNCGVEVRTNHTYTPDFKLTFSNGSILYVETKGRWLPSDRTKHIAVRKQHPEKDIRMVFSNPRQRLSKGTKGTYASWCAQKKILFDKKLIPEEWIQEQLP